MKKFLLSALFLSTTVFASGQISVEESYSISAKKVPPPTIGISVWENISGPFAYSMWTGLGHQARLLDDNVRWFVTKHELVYHIGQVKLGLGYSYKKAQKPDVGLPLDLQIDEHKVYGKVTLQLW